MASVRAKTGLETQSRTALIGKLNYLDFFGFGLPPFKSSAELSAPYLNAELSTALKEIESVLTHAEGGLIVVNGAPGSGKTTLANHAVDRCGEGFRVAKLNRTLSAETDFLQILLHGFELNPEVLDTAWMIERFIAFVDEQNRDGRRVILVIDEAQNLKPALLALLPRLIEHTAKTKTKKKRGLFVVLIGQDGFERTLAHSALTDVKNLVEFQTYLNPLNESDTCDYIQYHLIELAKARQNPFTERAMARLYMLTGGSMRLINTLCDFVLFNACLGQIRHISPDLVQTTFNALQWEPVLGTMQKAAAKSPASQTDNPRLILEYAQDTPFAITKAAITIGRASDNDIRIRSLKVSRYHARLTADGANLSIEDLGSTNGVYVNDERIIARQLLKDGDILTIDSNRMRLMLGKERDTSR